MHLPFLNRTKVESPLYSITHIPGTVAAYFPYMDVVGRNVSRYTSVAGMIIYNATNTGDTLMETATEGSHGAVFAHQSDIGVAQNVSVRVRITPIGGRKRFILGHPNSNWWVIYDTTTLSVINQGVAVSSASIISGESGSFILTATIQNFLNYPQVLSTHDTATSIADRNFVGDVTKGFTLHEWQVNLGQLYPYSAPVGLPQVLTDFSGHGNHAQLGSTAGADTNDPSFATNALTFGGDDYCVAPNISTGIYPNGTIIATALVTNSANTLPLVNISGNERLSLNYKGNEVEIIRTGNATAGLQTKGGAAPINQWNCVAARYYVSGGDTTLSLATNGAFPSTEVSENYYNGQASSFLTMIGKNYRSFLTGSVVNCLFFNRQISDAEYVRIYNNLKTLLAGRGVSFA